MIKYPIPMFLMAYSLFLLWVWLPAAMVTAKEKIYYADLERIEISYFNPKYFTFVNASARRYSRRDPTHYVTLHYESLVPFGSNVYFHLYIFEFLSNEYRRSFVEAHYNICDLILKDDIFGPFIRRRFTSVTGRVWKTCPFPKDIYQVVNASVPSMPVLAQFPFVKGRLYVNETWNYPNGTKELMVNGHVDVLIKSRWV